MGLLIMLAIGVWVFLLGNGDNGGGNTPTPGEPAPDLAITAATVQRADAAGCGGSTTCLVVTVTNLGSADATGLEDGCGTSDFGDPAPFSSFTFGGNVPAGSTVMFRSGFESLEPHLPATFTLDCEVDASNRVAESDEGNNTYSTIVSL